jgi:hypothetical protein
MYYSSKSAPNSPIPTACAEAGRVLAADLFQFKHPDEWKYIIACDERSWDDIMGWEQHGEQSRDTFGSTLREAHTTLFRGESLTGKGDTRFAHYEIVAHELCHIDLHTGDERRVRLQAEQWVTEYRRGNIARR